MTGTSASPPVNNPLNGPLRSPGPPRPSRRSPSRRTTWLGVVAAVAVAVIVLVALGVIPVFSNSSTESAAVPFLSARASSDAAALGVRGGPWSLWYIEAVDSSRVAPGWEFTPWGGLVPSCLSSGFVPSFPPVPSFTGSVTSGEAPFWMFSYENATGTSLLITVVNGTAAAVATFPNASQSVCRPPPGGSPPVPSSGLVDSSQIVARAAAANATFVATAGPLNATFTLDYQAPSPAPWSGNWIWEVQFTSCPVGLTFFPNNSTHYAGESENELVYATNGTLAAPAQLTVSTECYSLAAG